MERENEVLHIRDELWYLEGRKGRFICSYARSHRLPKMGHGRLDLSICLNGYASSTQNLSHLSSRRGI